MRYAFIINPAAGKGAASARIESYVEQLEKVDKRSISHVRTDAGEGATAVARELAQEAKLAGEEIYIYAVGGDGTINEVANGICGFDNAALGVMPAGSGNDFVRCFRDNEPSDFLDVDMQLAAEPKAIDLMELTYYKEGQPQTRLCVNGINIGLDGNTAILANELKSNRYITGGSAFIVALIKNFLQKKGENLKVTVDGEVIHDGQLLLCTAANGGFCGGGFESCPRFDLSDGLAEVLIVNNVSRRKFLALVPKYKAGKIFEVPGIEKITNYAQSKEVKIEPLSGEMQFVADGETLKTGSITIRMIKEAIRVLVPKEPSI